MAHIDAGRIECHFAMNEFRVLVRARDEAPLSYLDGFLDRTAAGPDSLPVLDIEPDDPPVTGQWCMDVDTQLVDVAPFERGYQVWSRTADRFCVWAAARRLMRDLWLRERLARSAVDFVHASALEDGRRLVLFVGDKRGGKTSLMLDGALRHGWRLVSNDCVVLFTTDRGATACGLPTYVGIRADVADRFVDRIRAGIHDDANLDSFTGWQQAPRTGGEDKLYLSHGAISRPVLPTIPLAERDVTVVAVSFARPGEPVSLRPLDDDPVRFLAANRKPATFIVDDLAVPLGTGGDLLGRLAAHARFLSYRHAGDVTEVLLSVAERPVPAT